MGALLPSRHDTHSTTSHGNITRQKPTPTSTEVPLLAAAPSSQTPNLAAAQHLMAAVNPCALVQCSFHAIAKTPFDHPSDRTHIPTYEDLKLHQLQLMIEFLTQDDTIRTCAQSAAGRAVHQGDASCHWSLALQLQ